MKPGHEMIPTNMRGNPVHPNTFWGGGLACRGSKHITRYSEDFVCLGEADSSHLVFLRPLFRHQNMKQIRSCDGIPIWVFGAIQKRSDKTRQWQVLSSVFLVLVGHRNIRNLRSACFSVHFVSSRTLTIQGFDRILDTMPYSLTRRTVAGVLSLAFLQIRDLSKKANVLHLNRSQNLVVVDRWSAAVSRFPSSVAQSTKGARCVVGQPCRRWIHATCWILSTTKCGSLRLQFASESH